MSRLTQDALEFALSVQETWRARAGARTKITFRVDATNRGAQELELDVDPPVTPVLQSASGERLRATRARDATRHLSPDELRLAPGASIRLIDDAILERRPESAVATLSVFDLRGGAWSFTGLEAGTYRVAIEAEGGHSTPPIAVRLEID